MVTDNPLGPLVRVEYEFRNTSERFVLTIGRSYPQYASLYYSRLELMKPRVQEKILERWGPDVPVKKLSDLVENQDCLIIGTLYKEMELKPSILKEFSEDNEIPIQPVLPRYASEHDTLLLEEESQRIVLIGDIDIHQIVTGVTAALFGSENDEGQLVVKEFCFVGMPPQPEFPVLKLDCYVAFLSGLNLGPNSVSAFTVDLCIEMLTGQLGTEIQQKKMSNVAALIIAGNLIEAVKEDENSHKACYLSRNVSAGSVQGIKMVDNAIVQLAACMDVYVMPGANDPGNYLLPQQPIHPCMLPLSNKSSGLRLVTNPFEAEFNGVKFLGTSGQNVSDIYKNSQIDNPLDSMEKTLTWAHIAPTAPDTLGCYPFKDSDPFILESTPHVYFAGNQTTASHRNVKGPRGQNVVLICVPDYSKQPSLTLVNLRNLEVETMTFQDAVK